MCYCIILEAVDIEWLFLDAQGPFPSSAILSLLCFSVFYHDPPPDCVFSSIHAVHHIKDGWFIMWCLNGVMSHYPSGSSHVGLWILLIEIGLIWERTYKTSGSLSHVIKKYREAPFLIIIITINLLVKRSSWKKRAENKKNRTYCP